MIDYSIRLSYPGNFKDDGMCLFSNSAKPAAHRLSPISKPFSSCSLTKMSLVIALIEKKNQYMNYNQLLTIKFLHFLT